MTDRNELRTLIEVASNLIESAEPVDYMDASTEFIISGDDLNDLREVVIRVELLRRNMEGGAHA